MSAAPETDALPRAFHDLRRSAADASAAAPAASGDAFVAARRRLPMADSREPVAKVYAIHRPA